MASYMAGTKYCTWMIFAVHNSCFDQYGAGTMSEAVMRVEPDYTAHPDCPEYWSPIPDCAR